jgi:hypothetical protein
VAVWWVPVILSTWEVEILRIMVQGQPRQKVLKNPSQPMPGCSDASIIPATQQSTKRRMVVQASLGIKQDLILKITNKKGIKW